MATKKPPAFCQHAVVTGGSSGIGRALVQHLVDGGASVTILDVSKLEGLHHNSIQTYEVDVTDSRQVEDALESAERSFGPVDFLATCAAIFRETDGRLPCTDPATFTKVMNVNFLGTVNCVQKLLPKMLESRRGRILLVSSISALKSLPFYAAYASSKAAVKAYADALRLETLETGVTIHVALPGSVNTPLLKDALSSSKDIQHMVEKAAYTTRLIVGPAPPEPSQVVELWLQSMKTGAYVLPFTALVTNLNLWANPGAIAPVLVGTLWEGVLLFFLSPFLHIFRLFNRSLLERVFRIRNRQRLSKQAFS
eukprot:jgi/Botrbrau1/12178/Bobra.0186s0086.1